MRAKEFVTENTLLEYSREVTAKNLGAKIAAAARDKEVVSPSTITDEELVHSILSNIEKADPTTNKKYTQWLARTYANTRTKIEDVLSTVHEYLYKFDLLLRRKKLGSEYSDINKYPSFENFMDVMDQFEMPVELQNNKGDAETVFEDDNVRIIVPRNEAASCYYGQGTRWCTAATKGFNYFTQYSQEGPLYILLPKHPTHNGEKYQIHFESEQFMDESDDGVDVNKLLGGRFPTTVPFFKQNAPLINAYIDFVDSSVIKEVLAALKRAVELCFKPTTIPQDERDEVLRYFDMSPQTVRELASEYRVTMVKDIDSLMSNYIEDAGDGSPAFSRASLFIHRKLSIRFDPLTNTLNVLDSDRRLYK